MQLTWDPELAVLEVDEPSSEFVTDSINLAISLRTFVADKPFHQFADELFMSTYDIDFTSSFSFVYLAPFLIT